MARLTTTQKAHRVLDLLMGLRHPRAAGILHGYGLDDAELGLGHRLLEGLATARHHYVDDGAGSRELIAAADAWENKWFPIVDVVLATHAPEAHARVLGKIRQTSGAEVLITVGIFVERILAEPAEVRDRLATRGVTAAVLAEGRAFYDALKTLPPTPTEDPEAAQAAAERALWAWYLEWSTIARRVVTDLGALRAMGFRSTTGGADA
jgi:hypothetical protein